MCPRLSGLAIKSSETTQSGWSINGVCYSFKYINTHFTSRLLNIRVFPLVLFRFSSLGDERVTCKLYDLDTKNHRSSILFAQPYRCTPLLMVLFPKKQSASYMMLQEKKMFRVRKKRLIFVGWSTRMQARRIANVVVAH